MSGPRVVLATEVVRRLAGAYPEAVCELTYGSPWELLVATVLSAQCTDVRVNQVTPELFARWPGPRELAEAPVEELQETIRSTGLFRSKARNLRAAARQVEADHGGEVPRDMEALTALPGVGRKTAKVVLGEAFGVAAGVAVDTHVRRVSRRLGLSAADDPDKVAVDLEALVPQEEWVSLSLRMILHGRRVCTARSPRCEECVLVEVCGRIGV